MIKISFLWESCFGLNRVSRKLRDKYTKKIQQEALLLDFYGWATEIRTQNNRTKICCVTVTPWINHLQYINQLQPCPTNDSANKYAITKPIRCFDPKLSRIRWAVFLLWRCFTIKLCYTFGKVTQRGSNSHFHCDTLNDQI